MAGGKSNFLVGLVNLGGDCQKSAHHQKCGGIRRAILGGKTWPRREGKVTDLNDEKRGLTSVINKLTSGVNMEAKNA